MEFALNNDIDEIVELYRTVIEAVNKTNIKLGWNIDIYPSREFVENAVKMGEMCILRIDDKIVSSGVVNHNVNAEYDEIDWQIKAPKDKISTIHALATLPDYRGGIVSAQMLKDIESYCKAQGDLAIHLDVIDTNVPALKLYLRNGYTLIKEIKMYYEVVGTRTFSMLERVF